MQVRLIKEKKKRVHTPSEDPDSQPTYCASPYQHAISCCLRIGNISITNIQAREKKKNMAEPNDGDGMWPTANHRPANHIHRRPPTSAQEQLRALGSFPTWSRIRSWYIMAISRNSQVSRFHLHFTFSFFSFAFTGTTIYQTVGSKWKQALQESRSSTRSARLEAHCSGQA